MPLPRAFSYLGSFLTTPIPVISDIPGIDRITGTHALKKLRAELDDSIHEDEMDRIDVDVAIMEDADLRDEHDREIQGKLFGQPVFNKEKQLAAITTASPELQPILDSFIELEKLKDGIRCNLRPGMEKQIKLVIETSKKTPHKITPELEGMFKDLQAMRLKILTERTHMIEQRNAAYQMVSLKNNGILKSSTDQKVLSQGRIHALEEIANFLASDEFHMEDETQKRIQEKRLILERHEQQTDTLKEEIEKKYTAQVKKNHKRPLVWAGALAGFAGTVIGGREGIGLYNSNRPLGDLLRPYGHVAFDTEEQAMPVFNRPYRNPFNKVPLEVSVHSAEQGTNEDHRKTVARLADIAAQAASGIPNPKVDLIDATLHPKTHVYFLIDPRSRAVEEMLTSTKDFHVFNHSVTSDYSFTPGSRSAKKERDLMLRITCPVAIPAGNEPEPGDVVDEKSQHIGDLSHYLRYVTQIGAMHVSEDAKPIEIWLNAPLELQMDKFIKSMVFDGSVNEERRQGLCATINKTLGIQEGEPKLTLKMPVDAAKALLVNALSKKYTGQENKLGAFLTDLGNHYTISTYKNGLSLSPHNHPYPFLLFPIPQHQGKYFSDRADFKENMGELEYSSDSSPGFAGHIAGIKRSFPQLSWDNIMHAVALGCYKDFPAYPAKSTYPLTSPDTDLTYSAEAGFGTPDPELTEKICQNMIYQRILHPEIQDKPEVIVKDGMNFPGKTHRIVVPPNKAIFKMILEMVPLDKTKDATVTLSDKHNNKISIKLVNGQPVSRFTDWSHLAQSGGEFTVTSDAPIYLNYAVHVNDPKAISLGINRLSELKSTEELKKLIDPDAAKALPISWPIRPAIIYAEKQFWR